MKRVLLFLLIIVCAFGYNELKSSKQVYSVTNLSSLANIESLANPEGDFTITCDGGWYGKCQLLRQYFCNNGNIAAHCEKTGDPDHYCSALMMIACTLVGWDAHP